MEQQRGGEEKGTGITSRRSSQLVQGKALDKLLDPSPNLHIYEF